MHGVEFATYSSPFCVVCCPQAPHRHLGLPLTEALHPSTFFDGWFRQWVHATGSHFVRMDALGIVWLSESNQCKGAPEVGAAFSKLTASLTGLSVVCSILDEIISTAGQGR